MTSTTRPPSGPVHPEVSADAGAAELVELSDEEVEQELRAAGVDIAADDAELEDGDEERSVNESGAWRASSVPPALRGQGPVAVPGAPAVPAERKTEGKDRPKG